MSTEKYPDGVKLKGLLPARLLNALAGFRGEASKLTAKDLRDNWNRSSIEGLKNVGATTLFEAEQLLHDMGVAGYESPPVPPEEQISLSAPIGKKLWTCDGGKVTAVGVSLTEADVHRLLRMFDSVRLVRDSVTVATKTEPVHGSYAEELNR